ncbi:ATP-binding cassette domain-containing protein [Bacillus sp. ISL-35]|uniref:ABC transporter ATP-binding protein n=1 Tax=Bacillus sp. ISL-35 TaxID=2819122 RepID=UPI001BE6EE26|nr:ATP-binding cassette domain-containing protein [Bacillus sp. ISL-35]MBT2678890.1 ATP-binding cassette domain-containing protein [Bacillus sp. ISL-35]MBT2703882.1 ATP-binding cassette domain-containing protein [Chryseobacterium sp. ISL-80]
MFVLKNVTVNGILQIEQLVIPENQFTCILGPSGSGKSTLLRLLNDLSSPDEGEIAYENKSVSEIDPLQLRRTVVMVPQMPVIFPGSIEDNLQIGLAFSEKETASAGEMESLLKMFMLDKKLGDDAENLSGGEKQRLSWARAMLLDPEVFLLDEPTSALDEDTARTVLQRFREYAEQHSKTVVMITHSKELAEIVAENTIDMSQYSIESRVSR